MPPPLYTFRCSPSRATRAHRARHAPTAPAHATRRVTSRSERHAAHAPVRQRVRAGGWRHRRAARCPIGPQVRSHGRRDDRHPPRAAAQARMSRCCSRSTGRVPRSPSPTSDRCPAYASALVFEREAMATARDLMADGGRDPVDRDARRTVVRQPLPHREMESAALTRLYALGLDAFASRRRSGTGRPTGSRSTARPDRSCRRRTFTRESRFAVFRDGNLAPVDAGPLTASDLRHAARQAEAPRSRSPEAARLRRRHAQLPHAAWRDRLMMRDGDTIVFVEVRCAHAGFGGFAASITAAKQCAPVMAAPATSPRSAASRRAASTRR